jgi:TolB protein
VVVGLALLMPLVSVADASFPGANGKIAFDDGAGDIWVMNPDGTDPTQLTSSPETDVFPAWSPDGTKIAFSRSTGIFVMNADGSDQHEVIASGSQPSWSPDGSRLTYTTGGQVWTADADGSNPSRLLVPPESGFFAVECCPDWSPDGVEIAFGGNCENPCVPSPTLAVVKPDGMGYRNLADGQPFDWSPNSRFVLYADTLLETWKIQRDGTGPQFLTDYSFDAAWSPDGTKIVRSTGGGSSDIVVMDSDGIDGVVIGSGYTLDWQPVPINSYPRPAGARKVQASLVPAFRACDPDHATQSHGPPLAHASCGSPMLTSGYLTLGTGDVNGQAPNSHGRVLMIQRGEIPVNPSNGDQADVSYDLRITDVRKASDLSDYTGELEVVASLRLTDRLNAPSPVPNGAATVSDTQVSFTAPCTATAGSSGATCAVITSADAVLPGTVTEGKRSVWELGKLRVFDGGADGDAQTGGNTLFATQGVFVP